MIPLERRLKTRKPLEHLAYLSLPADNGGIVLDVSEGGLRFHSIAPVNTNGEFRFRFAIDSATSITAAGQLVWDDGTGKSGGLRFTELPSELREKIRLWAGQPSEKARAKAIPVSKPSISNVFAPAPIISADIPPSEDPELLPVLDLESLIPAIAAEVTLALNGGLNPAPDEPTAVPAATAEAAPADAASSASILEKPAAITATDEQVPSAGHAEAVPAVGVPVEAPSIVTEVTPQGRSAPAPATTVPVAGLQIEASIAPENNRHSTLITNPRKPAQQIPKPRVYSTTINSLFTLTTQPMSKTGHTAPDVPTSAGIKHPIAAVAMTIALAFLVSIAMFSYVFTIPAGETFVQWGESIWSGSHSRQISQEPAPQAAAQDSSSMPQQ